MGIKHEITDENTLELLESIFLIYKACHIANNYSDVVSTAIEELQRKKVIPLENLLLCFLKKEKGLLTFPAMLRWKKRQQSLLIHDELLPVEFEYNDWKKYVEISEYIEHQLLNAHVQRIKTFLDKKTVVVSEQERAVILHFQEKFVYDTIDRTIGFILEQTAGWRVISFITRLLYENITLREIDLMMKKFGNFIFIFAEEHDEKVIKIVTDFYPFIYDNDFLYLVNEVSVNVRCK
jgi:ferric iron reductase protein FhuF